MALDLVNGNWGLTIRRTVKNQSGEAIDVSSATTKVLYLKAPSGTITTVTMAYTNGTGTDGQLEYTTVTGDIDEVGAWQLQLRVITSAFDLTSELEDWAQVHERFV